MSDYIVSARKYRPDSFTTLIGQDNISKTLRNSIQREQLAHAYLFCGPRGVGKTSTARIFAKTINCANPGPGMEPCGECESCRSFAEGRSYCIHELDAASNNGVEDIKALMDKVQIPPQVGHYSVYIIDEVHMLSQSAFNAFLKTLEEPPSHAIFILCTTEKHKILPTILSRCQTYDFNRIGIPDIVRNLKGIASAEGISIDEESLHIIAKQADGAMRDALTIFDQTVAFCGTQVNGADVKKNLNFLDYEYGFKLVDAFLAKDYATALMTFDEVLRKGFNSLHFISSLGSHLRDLLVSRTGGLESLLDLPESLAQKYAEQASRCSVQFLYEALGVISQCEAGYKSSTNQRLHIEYALMRMAFLGGVPASTVASAPAPVAASEPAARPVVASAPSAPVAASSPAAEASASGSASLSAVAQDRPVSDSGSGAPQGASKIDSELADPAPKPVRRAAPKTGASLSLSALTADDPVEAAPIKETPAAVAQPSAAALPSEDLIRQKWAEMVEGYKTDKPRLAIALAAAKLSFNDGDGWKELSFEVVNEAQKRWIEEKLLRELETGLNNLCGSTRLRLAVTVTPDEEVKIVNYLPAEKARDLIGRNENVKELVKDLGLDTK